MKNWMYISIVGALSGCLGGMNDGDSGILYPNPKAAPASFRLAMGTTDRPNILLNGAAVPNLSTLTFQTCEGETETLTFNQTLLTSDPDTALVVDTDALLCAETLTIDATDLDDVPALMVGVTYNPGTSEELTVRLSCPADVCFPMTFSGLLQLPSEDEVTGDEGASLVWNALTDLSFLEKLEDLQDDAPPGDEPLRVDAGSCDELEACTDMERVMTQEGIIEYALPGQDTNTVGMTSTGGN